MRRARYEIPPDDGSCCGEIPGLQGVWARGETLEACRNELQSVLEDSILVRVADQLPVPGVDGITLSVGAAVYQCPFSGPSSNAT